MAKNLARELGYVYIDTGAMYRTVTLFAHRNNIFNGSELDAERFEALLPQVKVSFVLDPETNLPLACLNGEVVEREIRTMEVSSHVSPVAALPLLTIIATIIDLHYRGYVGISEELLTVKAVYINVLK